MKTVGIIAFTINLLRALYEGYTDANKKNVEDLEEYKITKHNGSAAHVQPYIGIGIMIIAGAFLILGRKKS